MTPEQQDSCGQRRYLFVSSIDASRGLGGHHDPALPRGLGRRGSTDRAPRIESSQQNHRYLAIDVDSAAMQTTELQDAVDAISWYHKMELPGGIVTPGESDTARGLPRLRLPERLDGLSVLDIGAWDGFYSFEAKRRGAARVLATDSFSWTGPGWGSKAGFLLVRRALGLDVEDLDIDVMELAPDRVGTFDVVLLLGVLYHLKDPITAIERAASVTNHLLIVETVTNLSLSPFPAARLFVGSELNNDDTNWWALNPTALHSLLKRAGFQDVQTVYRTQLARRVARALDQRIRHQRSFWSQVRGARIVLHARKERQILRS
jgi:tRNA (mo5U34)-methyltransferase